MTTIKNEIKKISFKRFAKVETIKNREKDVNPKEGVEFIVLYF